MSVRYPTICLSDSLTYEVISYFGSVGNVAKALGISHASVSGWGEVIPKGRAFEIQALTEMKLKVNPELYLKPNQTAA